MEELSICLTRFVKWHHGYCSVVPKAMADYEFLIWHTFFLAWRVLTTASTHNSDLRCLLDFLKVMIFFATIYKINGHQYIKGYYLADIYDILTR
jgi:hypothetical protein